MNSTRWTRSPSAVALAVTAVVAVVQAVLFAGLIATQRNSAHVIDISGLQRMQSQRVAYLALAARDGSAAPDWRAEMDRALETMAAGRKELASSAEPDEVGLRMADRYVAAARAIQREPSDAAAFATIRELREDLLRRFDAAVKRRVADLKIRNDRFVEAMLAGLALQLLVIGLSWIGLSAPAERKIAKLLGEITEQHDHMRSLFDENPDAIAVYDEHGCLARINRARAALGGHSRKAHIGRHYTSFVAAQAPPGRPDPFMRAAMGETVTLETLFRADNGELIDVKMTFFPNVVRGKPKGVIVVSKDIRALKRAERNYAEQSQRLADLYAIAAAHGKSMRQRISDALTLASNHLGYASAAVSEISAGQSTIVATYGDPSVVSAGAHEGLHRAVVNHLVNSDDVWSVDDFASSPWLRGATDGSFRSMTGMRIEADEVLYGAVAFAAPTVRAKPLSDGDRHFLRLVAALLGSIIERDQRERKLDSLAFFDALTGLPNRVLLLDRLEERVTAARHRNMHFALCYIDLDRFKAVNDDAGHSAGDAVLRAVANRLQQCARENDTVARLSGDEFVVLRAGTDGLDDFAQRIVHALGEPIGVKDQMHTVGASVGIALFPQNGESGLDLLAAADAALYHAKRNGRNRHAFASELTEDVVANITALRPNERRARKLRA